MILIDSSQMFIANMMVHMAYNDNKVDIHAYKNSIYESILNYNKKYSSKYGEVILCIDAKKPWRREVFDNYKAVRRSNKKKDTTKDWALVYDTINIVKSDLIEHFPFKVVECARTEADDVIAVLVKNTKEPTLIISSDKDYFQLHRYAHVKQYSPMTKKLVSPSQSASNYLREHIIRGDRGDGVPNLLSDDSVFVNGGRQTPISKKKVEGWIGHDPKEFCDDEMFRNFQRNELLIDFDYIPEDIVQSILTTFSEVKTNKKSKLLDYFITNKYKNFIAEIDNF